MKFRPRTANLILLLLLLNASCKKDNHTSTNTTPPHTVYVLGTWVDTAVYWKNGVVNDIPGAIVGGYNYSSSAIAVSGNNVYAVGYESNNNNNNPGAQPTYWLNGAVNILPDSSGNAYTNCIFVSGNDVYIGGTTNYWLDTSHIPYTTPTAYYPPAGSTATLWKNGTPVMLPGISYAGVVDSGKFGVHVYSDYVTSIYVDNGNVYVAGGSFYQGYHAKYWDNGVPVDLSDELNYTTSTGGTGFPNTTSIYVSANDVYVAGFQTTSTVQPVAIYWKNGAPVFLSTDSISGSEANSIFVSGSDVYVAGYQNMNNYSRAMLWKNGTPTPLTGGNTASVATSVVVAGNDVYVAGYQWVVGGYYIATYWHNGVPVNLTDGTSNAIANSISVQ